MDVRFREVKVGDLKRLNEIVNDEEVAHFLSVIPPVSMKSTRTVYEGHKKSKNLWYCIIVEGVVAGAMNLTFKRRDSKMSHIALFGIDIAKEYWGGGLGTKAIRFMVRKAKELGVTRLELEVVAENARARRLYEKNRFVVEGVKRRGFRINGRYNDTVLMARLL